MPDSSPDGEAVPPSRRAAREAARRAATGETPTQAGAAPTPAPAAPAPAEAATTWESLITGATPIVGSGPTAPAAPAAPPPAAEPAPGSGFQPVPLRTPRPTTEPVDIVESSAADDSWIFAGAGVGPAMPYSRSGAASTAPGSAASPAGPTASAPSAAPRDARREQARQAPVATLDDLFSGSTSTEDIGNVPPAKNKKRRRIGGWIALGVVLLILGGIAGGAYYVWTTYEDQIREVMGWEEPKDYEAGLANGETYVTIAQGDTGSPISQSLFDAGVTKTADAFYDYLITSGQNPMFQPGVYKLQKQMTSEAALAALLDAANKQEFTAQIPEGYTVDGTLERISEGTGIPLADLQAAAADASAYGVPVDPAIVATGGQPLEGWLFPATYTFDPSVTAQSAIQTLVDRTVQSLDAAGVPVERRQEILTTASIIQREARYEVDMQKVSRVILNRLDPGNQETFGKLQMDSTAQYGFGEMHDGTVSSSEEALNDPNPWNTYYHTGLPIGPISNPGDVAINAAMHPADGPWLYFVTVNLDTGETQFTSTYSEHLKYVDQWQQWCSEHPDQGC
ncbi:ABC transporter substrate-binding protein [Microbacterium sp. B35-04]|uniref:endolytic transglycosylase MltG n=1 Tax=Microbacterium sp. B35-04 TaxID=1961716 RepID=UPI001EF99370|nr:endolytic transglycosylase MltG [Microbacterium sp. B35-04]KAF2411854.1 ABC transporter substrate-binding protein [Microbacterium sp. B35-04]